MDFDVIAVGGGVGGASLAWALAREGIRVLVLERELQFRDRVRGEGILPWGVNEAKDLGVYDILVRGGAYPIFNWTSHMWQQRPPRDLLKTTPRGSHCLNIYHPRMQEVLLGAAEEAGAIVRRGAVVKMLQIDERPGVLFECSGRRENASARWVVGADGRASNVRQWARFQLNRDPERLVIAGLLLEGTRVPSDSVHVFRESSRGEGALMFPLGTEQTRTYFVYRKQGERRGLSGTRQVKQFLDSCQSLNIPSGWLDEAQAAGPLAEFEGADFWVQHPFRRNIALIGAAAASNDPAWGNGLSITLRDVRRLRDLLTSHEDWGRAGDEYAEAHDRDFLAINRVTGWLTDLLYEVGPEADLRRERAFALMKHDRSRNPDYIAMGPESPSDENARMRMFGEDQQK